MNPTSILIAVALTLATILVILFYIRGRKVRVLRRRVRSAWANLPSHVKARLRPKIKDAHHHLVQVRNVARTKKTKHIAHQPKIDRHLAMVQSLLADDADRLLRDATSFFFKRWFTIVDSDGQIYFGGVDYDSTDLGWAYGLVALAETWGQLPPFNTQPAVIQIPDDAKIAIVGDWGGNNKSAQQVIKAMSAKNPDYWIHIGDVYYAGTMPPEEPYQFSNFVKVWPHEAAGKSFTMNSNHDMLAQGTGYFHEALASPKFAAQQGCSYFALHNKNFRIVALDSAYFAPDELYNEGNLGDSNNPAQLQFLADQAKQAAEHQQHLVLLTHHNGFSTDGSKKMALWSQVGEQLAALKGKGVLWYWGHEHTGNVFFPQTTLSGVTIYPRCCGHGCLPWGVATGLESSPYVSWFERNVVGPGSNYFVSNGFAMLNIQGASLTETFFDQSGTGHWSAQWPVSEPQLAKIQKAGS